MEKIVNKENDWDHMIRANMVDGSMKKVTHKEIVIAIKAIKPEKKAGPSKVCTVMISASDKVGISVMMEIFHVLNGKEMPDEWRMSVYTKVKLFKHAMNIVETVLERI